MDIAGLVKGASNGEGLGNAFLSHIKETDAIFHVVRAFEDVDIVHSELDVNPLRDMDIINEELLLKDIEILDKRINDVDNRLKKMNKNEDVIEKEILMKVKALFDSGKWLT